MSDEEKNKIRESRYFRYYLQVGECFMIDEDILTEKERKKYKDYIGKVGVIESIYSDLHAFCFGSAYGHTVSFDGVLPPKRFDNDTFTFAREGDFPTELIKSMDCFSLEYINREFPEATKESCEKLNVKIYEKELEYICDDARHLICLPYSLENLHRMARELNIKKCWFHKDHYDIPKKRIAEITAKCRVVTSKEIVLIVRPKK